MEPPWRCSDWLDTATVTAQGHSSRQTRRTRDEDLNLATSEDLYLATTGDFFMATGNNLPGAGACACVCGDGTGGLNDLCP